MPIHGKKLATILLLAAGLSMGVVSAQAAGGDSGGSSMPSGVSSGPSFDPAAEYRSGIAALETGEFKKAEKAFSKVLTAAPKDANTNYLMGLAKVGRDKTKASRRYFSKAVKYRPGFVAAHAELGKAYAVTGKPKKAQDQLSWFDTEIIACASVCENAAKLQNGRAAIAAALAGNALPEKKAYLQFQSPGQGDALYLQAIRLINQNQFEQALVQLRFASMHIGPHPDILNYQGFSNRKLGRFDQAKQYYNQALRINPDHRGANEYLGELYIETGELRKARKQLAKLQRICTFACAEEQELKTWLLASAQ